MAANPGIDPVVTQVVTSVRDRFGADGLRSLIDLARDELSRVEQAQQTQQPGGLDLADTQAWRAFTDTD